MTNAITATAPQSARSLWVLGDRVTFMGKMDGRNLSVIELDVPPGSGTPPHSHASLEIFRVREGEITFGLFDGPAPNQVLAGPGTVVMVPSHARHNYSNAGSVPAAMTVVLEQQMIDFFEELGTTQPPEAGPPSAEMMERVMQSCARHGIVILDQAERAA